MGTPGQIERRFYWELIGKEYRIFDRKRGAGCFGENYIAVAVDVAAAEMLCDAANGSAA